MSVLWLAVMLVPVLTTMLSVAPPVSTYQPGVALDGAVLVLRPFYPGVVPDDHLAGGLPREVDLIGRCDSDAMSRRAVQGRIEDVVLDDDRVGKRLGAEVLLGDRKAVRRGLKRPAYVIRVVIGVRESRLGISPSRGAVVDSAVNLFLKRGGDSCSPISVVRPGSR